MLKLSKIKVRTDDIICSCQQDGVNACKFTFSVDKETLKVINQSMPTNFAMRQAYGKLYRLIKTYGFEQLPPQAYVVGG